MLTEQQKIIKKVEALGQRYLKLGCLFTEYSHSLAIQNKKINTLKEFKSICNIDIDKLKEITKEDISIFKENEV